MVCENEVTTNNNIDGYKNKQKQTTRLQNTEWKRIKKDNKDKIYEQVEIMSPK